MNFSDCVFKSEERVTFALRHLYEQYGYARYKVSKFEEYDLYAHNKNFLISENILSFTDTNGKLMALKPDVTLSIVKNVRVGETQKLYYNETVYRTSAGYDGFREIPQTGLECVGDVDLFSMGEVLGLAKQSLEIISRDHILDVSHMGFLSALLEEAGFSSAECVDVIREIGNKNLGAIRRMCELGAVSDGLTRDICALTSLYEPFEAALETIRPMVRGEKMRACYQELCDVWTGLSSAGCSDRLYLDFSMVNDMNYYNGIIFRGYVNGIPDGILSGGRYDSLLKKMGKSCGAIGFAVYLDQLGRIDGRANEYDTDILLCYGEGVSALEVQKKASELRALGNRVLVLPSTEQSVRAKETVYMEKGGV